MVGVVDLAVQRNRIVAGHTVFRNANRHFVPFIQEFRAPTQSLGRDRPLNSCLGETGLSLYKYRLSVFAYGHGLAVVNVLSVEVNGLADQLHIFLGNFGKTFLVHFQSFLRIVT